MVPSCKYWAERFYSGHMADLHSEVFKSAFDSYAKLVDLDSDLDKLTWSWLGVDLEAGLLHPGVLFLFGRGHCSIRGRIIVLRDSIRGLVAVTGGKAAVHHTTLHYCTTPQHLAEEVCSV